MNVQDALDVVLGPDGLGNFNFESAEDRGRALTLFLLPHLRERGVRFDDGTPLHWITGPDQGVGKTSLGRVCVNTRLRPYPRSEGDRAAIIEDAQQPWESGVVFFDNVHETVQSTVLASAMTSPERRGGQLIWVMTVQPGVRGSADFLGPRGRAVEIHLAAEPPDGPLPAALSADEAEREAGRAELDAAGKALVEAWDQAGRPERSGPAVTRWRRWEAVLGGVIDALGPAVGPGVTFQRPDGIPKTLSRTGDVVTDTFSVLFGTERRTTTELYTDPNFSAVVGPLCKRWTPEGLSQLLQHRRRRGLLASEGQRPATWWVPSAANAGAPETGNGL
jgi:hypothetical protein